MPPLAPLSEARRSLVEQQIFKNHYNTNYTASWYLVRSDVLLDSSGNLQARNPGCPAAIQSTNSTLGPVKLRQIDNGKAPSNTIPLMADGAPVGTLLMTVGSVSAGELVVAAATAGPVLKTTLTAPIFPPGHPKDGPTGWWVVWNREVLQDYRGFGAVHRGGCNVLFADGGVRTIQDVNDDGLLNNGFPGGPLTGYRDDQIDADPVDFMSMYSLNARRPS
jgi:prepilin-type processing-associated H-X9-DG protein